MECLAVMNDGLRYYSTREAAEAAKEKADG